MRGLRPTSLQRWAIAIRSSADGVTITKCAPVTYSNSWPQAGQGQGSVRMANQSPSSTSSPSCSAISSSSQMICSTGRSTEPSSMLRRIASPGGCRARCRSSRLRRTEPRGTDSRAAPARRACRASSRGRLRRSALLRELSASAMSEPLEDLELVDAAAQVSAWCGEPLLYDGDDPASTLAPGTARRRALDAALEEIAAGVDAPSPSWRFRFSLMLGLERVLADDAPALANGLTLRPHQVDALAGMLAALTAGEERDS